MRYLPLIYLFFTSSLFGAFLNPPMEPVELAQIERDLDMNWELPDGVFHFLSTDTEAGFAIHLGEGSWKELPKKIRKKFSKKGEKYTFARTYTPKERARSDSEDYFLTKPRHFEEETPRDINLEELASWVKDKNILFYTGAGLSASAGVPTMHGLTELFSIDEGWVERMVKNPKKVVKAAAYFHEACFHFAPTKAHWALTNISREWDRPLLTENLDHLHQKTGISPFCVTAPAVKEAVTSEEMAEIDAIICIGMSADDKGFLGWFKECASDGKIISIDIGAPTYLGREDFLLKGDAQEVLPALEKVLGKKPFKLVEEGSLAG